jgi:hypothetical protein
MGVLTTVNRKARSAREFLRGLTDTSHPLLVQIIPIRRCNIDCGYCNEYDKVSPPVPADALRRRIDKLAELGTSVVAFSGGEPMLHPDLNDLIRHIRSRGMMAGLITNGYFLVPKRIEELNSAGLDFPQISIDNVEPDEVSKKSLRVLDKKLQHLREHAAFDVNINSVLGGGIRTRRRRTINTRASSVLHLDRHHPRRLGAPETARPGGAAGVRRRVRGDQRRVAGLQEPLFRNHQLSGQSGGRQAERVAVPRRRALPVRVRRRSGALLPRSNGAPGRADRVLHRGRHPPGVRYAEVLRAICTVGCVHRVSTMDFWRSPQDLVVTGQSAAAPSK